MNFTMNGTAPKTVQWNGADVEKILYNGSVVWQAADEHPYVFTLTSDDAAYEIGLNASARYTFTSDTLTLPTSYNGKPIRGIESYGFSEDGTTTTTSCWTSFKNTVKTLIIPNATNCYTYIGEKGFYKTHLSRVDIQSTRMASIGESAFENSQLTSINLDPITASLWVEESVFSGCNNLKAISFPASTYVLRTDCLYTGGDTLVVYLKGNPRVYGIFGDDSWGCHPYVYCGFSEDSVVWGGYSDTSAPDDIQGWSLMFQEAIDNWQIFYDYEPSRLVSCSKYGNEWYAYLSYTASSSSAIQINLPITYNGYPITAIDNIYISGGHPDTVSIHIPASIEYLTDDAVAGSFTTGSAIKTVQYDNCFGRIDGDFCFSAPITNLIIPNGANFNVANMFQTEFNDDYTALSVNAGKRTQSITFLPSYCSALTNPGGLNSTLFPALTTVKAPENVSRFSYGFFSGLSTLTNFPFAYNLWTWDVTDEEGEDYTYYFGDNTGTAAENTKTRISWLVGQKQEAGEVYSVVDAYTALSKISIGTQTGGVGYNGQKYYYSISITNGNSYAIPLVLSCPKQTTATNGGGVVYDPFASTSVLTNISVPANETTSFQAILGASSGYSRPYVLFETTGGKKGYYQVAYPVQNALSTSNYSMYDDI